MSMPSRNAGSFRDPSGHVFDDGDRVLRTVRRRALDSYDAVARTGILTELQRAGLVIESREVDAADWVRTDGEVARVVEHPRIPFISYPYEWPFELLKRAALLHLDIQLRALEAGVMLSDASAFNVQFIGCRPVFIDLLSFRPYEPGELWGGHRQFCEQFLAPLLLQHACGIPHNAWMRGSMHGISLADLNRILPLRQKMSLRMLLHVSIPAKLQAGASRRSQSQLSRAHERRLPRKSLAAIFIQLRQWIASMEPRVKQHEVFWGDYAQRPGYATEEQARKRAFVSSYAQAVRPACLWDLGANTAEYSEVALSSGAQSSIAFDSESAVLGAAIARATSRNLNLLPLVMDLSDPSPSQGWAGAERTGLDGRAGADGLLALAFVHHLAIARNIPLQDVVRWLTSVAPTGVIEFVPKTDPTVQRMLAFREDIFSDYSREAFVATLSQCARIVSSSAVSSSGRELFHYSRA